MPLQLLQAVCPVGALCVETCHAADETVFS